jgi:hypothetical protein
MKLSLLNPTPDTTSITTSIFISFIVLLPSLKVEASQPAIHHHRKPN